MIFDTSAIVALIKSEPGADVAYSYLHKSLCSAVNYAEATAYFAREYPNEDDIKGILEPFTDAVVDFTGEVSFISGCILPRTQRYGLSLGDRACLATAMALNLPVLTADRVWKDMEKDLRVTVELIR